MINIKKCVESDFREVFQKELYPPPEKTNKISYLATIAVRYQTQTGNVCSCEAVHC